MTAELEDLAGEVWRDITGFEELYQVSNRGRVKSLGREETHKPGRGRVAKRYIRRASLSKTGYLQLNLCEGGKSYCRRIHKLVAKAFVDNPKGLPEVKHIDGDKTNNVAENLMWCSKQDSINAYRAEAKPKQGADNSCAALTWEEVSYIRSDCGLTQKELADMFGVAPPTIHGIIKYKTYKNNPMEETKNG